MNSIEKLHELLPEHELFANIRLMREGPDHSIEEHQELMDYEPFFPRTRGVSAIWSVLSTGTRGRGLLDPVEQLAAARAATEMNRELRRWPGINLPVGNPHETLFLVLLRFGLSGHAQELSRIRAAEFPPESVEAKRWLERVERCELLQQEIARTTKKFAEMEAASKP